MIGLVRRFTTRPTFWAFIVRHQPVTVQRDADLATLLLLKFLTVELDSICMGEDQIVRNTVRG